MLRHLAALALVVAACVPLTDPLEPRNSPVLDCIGEALGVDLPPPKIVMLKRSEMQALFGSYDGYYRQGTIYLTGGVSDQLLAHEYARYGLHYAGLGNDPVRLVELERGCQ